MIERNSSGFHTRRHVAFLLLKNASVLRKHCIILVRTMFLIGSVTHRCMLWLPSAEDKTIWETGMYFHVCAFTSPSVEIQNVCRSDDVFNTMRIFVA